MKKTKLKFLCGLLTMLLTLLLISPVQAQKVPINFDEYHGYTGTSDYLKKVAKAYPDITELLEIGQSSFGKPIYVLVISNMKNGTTLDQHVALRNKRKENVQNVLPMKSHMGKPGHFISGGTHGNEYTGTEVCLYITDKLLTGYGKDEEITRLIDQYSFYICPTINPEGVYNSVEKGIAQRSNSAKKDDDEDGKINEDGPDDLNGDGYITQFRYPDPNGRYIADEKDPRILVRAGRNVPEGTTRYNLITEDKDNDGDGKRGEDGESGIDLNRNYPEGWWTDDGFAGGSGKYPTSAPETQAIAEFFTNYRNIFMCQFYHTSGGFTYRAMGTAPHTQMGARDVLVFDYIMGKKYLEILGHEVPEVWKNPQQLEAAKKKLQKEEANKYAIIRGYELPRGWRVSYSEDRDRRYGYGMATDWVYKQYGIYSITTELWNPAEDIPGLLAEGEEADYMELQRKIMAYQDNEYKGELFLDWIPYTHPELGKGELGGWKAPISRNNAFPGKPLEEVCRKHYEFELFRAGLMPLVEITNVEQEVLYDGKAGNSEVEIEGEVARLKGKTTSGSYKVVKITAEIRNSGALPTHIERGERLPGNRQDVVWLLGEKQLNFIQGEVFQEMGVLDGTMPIPTQNRRLNNSRKITWIVGVEGRQSLKIVASSQKGGTAIQEITIK